MEKESEVERIFKEQIKPFEERITKLEEIEANKDKEIESLKQATMELHSILNELQNDKMLNSK